MPKRFCLPAAQQSRNIRESDLVDACNGGTQLGSENIQVRLKSDNADVFGLPEMLVYRHKVYFHRHALKARSCGSHPAGTGAAQASST